MRALIAVKAVTTRQAPALLRAVRPSARGCDSGQKRWNQQAAAQSHLFDDHDALRRQLLYRSKQRGWLEVDLLLGSWASEFVMTLNEEQLVQYEAILNQETLDIYNFIIERDDVPEELETEVMQMLRKFAQESGVVGAGTPEDYEKNMKSKMSN